MCVFLANGQAVRRPESATALGSELITLGANVRTETEAGSFDLPPIGRGVGPGCKSNPLSQFLTGITRAGIKVFTRRPPKCFGIAALRHVSILVQCDPFDVDKNNNASDRLRLSGLLGIA